MYKSVLITFFLSLFSLPVFAIVEIRDTTKRLECDTIIDSKGVVSSVKIISQNSTYITYKMCDEEDKKEYTIAINQIKEIKSKSFTLKKANPVSILKKAKKAFNWVAISVIAFLALLVFFLTNIRDGSGGESKLIIIPAVAFLLSPFVVLGGFINSISVWFKAKKVGDKQAKGYATWGIILPLLALVLAFLLISISMGL
jgi:hypothetical protein